MRDQTLGILHVRFSRKYANLSVLDAEKLRDMYLESLVPMVPMYEGPRSSTCSWNATPDTAQSTTPISEDSSRNSSA